MSCRSRLPCRVGMSDVTFYSNFEQSVTSVRVTRRYEHSQAKVPCHGNRHSFGPHRATSSNDQATRWNRRKNYTPMIVLEQLVLLVRVLITLSVVMKAATIVEEDLISLNFLPLQQIGTLPP